LSNTTLENQIFSSAEIAEKLGLTNQTKNKKKYITPLLEAGLLEYTIPENPKAKGQKYILTVNICFFVGLIFIRKVRHQYESVQFSRVFKEHIGMKPKQYSRSFHYFVPL
jgi:AraC-like DNA-binding protein